MKDLRETVEENTRDISEIKHSIDTIRTNHLHHLEADMCKQSKLMDKLDNRIWWVLGILVVSTVIGMISDGL